MQIGHYHDFETGMVPFESGERRFGMLAVLVHLYRRLHESK
jgi:hypothetical protein